MLKLASTKVRITPDAPVLIGFLPPPDPQPLRDDLFGRLFLLDDGGSRLLVVSLDFGALYGKTQAEWQRRLGAAVGLPPERVALHCVHQHDTPFIFIEAAEMIQPGLDWSWVEDLIVRLEEAARALPGELRPVARLGWDEQRVHGFASNRQVAMEDGSVAIRYSRCANPAIRNRPVGRIDPMLRTLAFYGKDGGLLATWSFYATHPQVANEGKRFSADAPGEAMLCLAQRHPGAVHSLFNGCVGDVTAGKYSSPTDLEGNIAHFGGILADAITRNLANPQIFTADTFAWQTESFPFPERELTPEELAQRAAAHMDALLLAPHNRALQHPELFTISLLTLGDARILFFPGELYIAYQLFCQSVVPDEKLAVCGNCGDDPLYVPSADLLAAPIRSFATSTTLYRARPEFEPLFQAAVRRLLRP